MYNMEEIIKVIKEEEERKVKVAITTDKSYFGITTGAFDLNDEDEQEDLVELIRLHITYAEEGVKFDVVPVTEVKEDKEDDK